MRNFHRAALPALLLASTLAAAGCNSGVVSGPLEGKPYGSYESAYDSAQPLDKNGQPLRRVRRVDTNLEGYPNLATVPPRPTFPSPAERAADMRQLQEDRSDGQQLQKKTAPPPGRNPTAGGVPDPKLPASAPKTPALLPAL